MAWSRPPKEPLLGVLYPSKGRPTTEFMQRTQVMMNKCPVPWVTLSNKHYCLDYARNDLVDDAIEKGCTHILFHDLDVLPYERAGPDGSELTFAVNALARLMFLWNYPVVTFPYQTKRGTLSLYFFDGDVVRAVKEDVTKLPYPFFVDSTGLGMVLFQMEVFKTLPYPWFEFERKEVDGKPKEISEDHHFFMNAKEAGFSVLADTGLVGAHGAEGWIWPGGRFTNSLTPQTETA